MFARVKALGPSLWAGVGGRGGSVSLPRPLSADVFGATEPDRDE